MQNKHVVVLIFKRIIHYAIKLGISVNLISEAVQ